jgi:hypothetical protein
MLAPPDRRHSSNSKRVPLEPGVFPVPVTKAFGHGLVNKNARGLEEEVYSYDAGRSKPG